MESTKKRVVDSALKHAHNKWIKDLLIAIDNPDSEILMENPETALGDRETVYSIISLFSDDVLNDGTWEDAIEDALRKEYNSFF